MNFANCIRGFFLMGLLGSNAAMAESNPCSYNNTKYLTGPANGEPTFLFKGTPEPHAFNPGRYVKIQVCERPLNAGSYIIIVDGFNVAYPPQEVLEKKTESVGYWTTWTINTLDDGETLELLTSPSSNGNPQRMWVFTRSWSQLGNFQVLQALLSAP